MNLDENSKMYFATYGSLQPKDRWSIRAMNGTIIFGFTTDYKSYPNAWVRFWHGFFFGWKFERET